MNMAVGEGELWRLAGGWPSYGALETWTTWNCELCDSRDFPLQSRAFIMLVGHSKADFWFIIYKKKKKGWDALPERCTLGHVTPHARLRGAGWVSVNVTDIGGTLIYCRTHGKRHSELLHDEFTHPQLQFRVWMTFDLRAHGDQILWSKGLCAPSISCIDTQNVYIYTVYFPQSNFYFKLYYFFTYSSCGQKKTWFSGYSLTIQLRVLTTLYILLKLLSLFIFTWKVLWCQCVWSLM